MPKKQAGSNDEPPPAESKSSRGGLKAPKTARSLSDGAQRAVTPSIPGSSRHHAHTRQSRALENVRKPSMVVPNATKCPHCPVTLKWRNGLRKHVEVRPPKKLYSLTKSGPATDLTFYCNCFLFTFPEKKQKKHCSFGLRGIHSCATECP